MDIRADVTIPFPRPQVFEAYRDRLPELTQFLPNIRDIRVIRREERGDEIDLVNEWTGGGDIPAAARAVLKESMLRWTDHATWRGAGFLVAWRTEVHAFPGAVMSSGENRFLDAPDGTLLTIRGSLVCDASKVPGVPRLLARSVSGAVERVLVGQVQVNLIEVAKGVGKLLAQP